MASFDAFFRAATGEAPYGYQARLARDGLPAVVRVPTGAGKTGIILAWLWRRLEGPDRAGTPRRLIFALPQRSLVEQVAREAVRWLENLGLVDEVAVHVVMGGAGDSQRRWRLDMHRPAIVIGTVDSLVSKALNRGYGISRAMYPIDFALVVNGAQWVVDEIQLCPESTTTLRQLAAFTRGGGGASWVTAEPTGLTCMSATVSASLLDTVDNPAPAEADTVRIEAEDRVGKLAVRLGARRRVGRLAVEPGDYRSVASEVLRRHRQGTLTLVVVNTVAAARGVYAALRATSVPHTLLHSRFRGVEREGLALRVAADPTGAGHIVVATQVVEAGLDLDAAVLFTEAAPWPSVVQRAGRCNRRGLLDDAELWWLPPVRHLPYEEADVRAAVAELTALEGVAVTGEDLLDRDVPTTEPEVTVLRRADLIALFDTAPDLTGADLDVGPYVRDADDLDVQVAWADWTPVDATGRPAPQAKAPEARWRCRVPLGELRALAKRTAVWRFTQAVGQWTRVSDRQPARPGEVLVVAASAGGYDPESGFDPSARKPVPGCPSLDPTLEVASVLEQASGAEEAFRQDDASVAQGRWLSLERHSVDVRDHVEALIAAIGLVLPGPVLRAVAVAAYAHDVGKAHPTWQDALCALAGPADREWVDAGRPWAKSGVDGRLVYPDATTSFRHELVSLLLLDGPLRGLLADVEDPDLVRYLVLAHHGKLRIQVRGPDDTDDDRLLGLKHHEVVLTSELLGQPAGTLTVDLDQFGLGGARSWTRTALGLRDRYGPFVLAYLETLVRIADWRASADLEKAS
ncbi:CRISPR-associated helicase/endonuclease Cas3 [Micromonospora carbonacea]|uniref:CRISPR-associated endonuclease/helicase Cas3 n=1 Tax=Micromonospora carbonacea TaxID=47853 RepID=A0A1C4YDK3_9ACTN|nr:CRISPR-associated helicase/endonuclease Cas3 [Micromonospora carbonacea]SCF18750.1 CRISPR-associated endonuclease/helicase Cas3 [Micromonospora carbonacea]